MQLDYRSEPHPHIVLEEVVPADRYRSLRFPDALMHADEKWGLTSTDPEYATILQDPVWRALHDELRSEAFVQRILEIFGPEMQRAGCLVDPARARLTNYLETRPEKEKARLAQDEDPNALFTRLDFQSKGAGTYRPFVHLDWARRLIGGILFFSDAAEEGLEGGELALYRDRGFKNDRWCHDPELTTLFPPRRNSGVIFLNSNAAFHGPRPITKLTGRRRWLYYTISSRVDVWPCVARST